MGKIRHVLMPGGGGDFAACSLAEDESDDEFVAARPGLRVTCPDCCKALREWRQAAAGLRLAVPEAPQ